MQSLKKSCLRWAVLYFVLAAIASALVYARFPKLQFALGAGCGAAFFLWWSIAYVYGIRDRNAQARMIRRAASAERPQDGERVAIAGVASGSFDLFEAPMSKKRVLVCEYKVLPGANQTAASYEGFALAPTTIEGPRGAIRLLAAPELAFEQETRGNAEHLRNFREYIARTQWTEHRGIDIKREIAHMKSTLADDDGRIRYDMRRDRANEDLATATMWEKTIAPGEAIVAIGRYSSSRNALVPDPSEILYPVKIHKGEPVEIAKGLRSRNGFERTLSCGCLLPVIVAAVLALALVPLDAIEEMLPEKDPSWTEIRAERWLRQTLRPALAGFLPDSGEVVLALEPNQARGKLLLDGQTIPLERCSATREGDGITVEMMGNGAPVVARFRGDALESLNINGSFAAMRHVEVERFRATDTEVLGRITNLADPMLRVAFRAVILRREDAEGSPHRAPGGGSFAVFAASR